MPYIVLVNFSLMTSRRSQQKSTASSQVNVELGFKQLRPTPLPSLPSYEPDVATPTRQKSTSREDQEEFCLPSPSQLDPSVLAALPPSIRKNIERAYQARSKQQNRYSWFLG